MKKNIRIISILTIMIFVFGIFVAPRADSEDIYATLTMTVGKRVSIQNGRAGVYSWYTGSQQAPIKAKLIINDDNSAVYHNVSLNSTFTFANGVYDDVLELYLQNQSWKLANIVTGVFLF